jgi:hypothetical protein
MYPFLLIFFFVVSAVPQSTSSTAGDLPPPFPHAVKVANVSDWNVREFMHKQDTFYRWLSNNEVLFYRMPTTGGYPFFKLNILTGREESMTEFSDRFKELNRWQGLIPPGDGLPSGTGDLDVSPDGSSILWTGVTGVRTVSVDGKIVHTFKQSTKYRTVWRWTTKSNHIAEIVYEPYRHIRSFVLRDLANSEVPREIVLKPEITRKDIQYPGAIVLDGNSVIFRCVTSESPTVNTFRVTGKRIVRQDFPIAELKRAGYHTYCFSPDGGRALWLRYDRLTKEGETLSVCTSRVDCTDIHRLGIVRAGKEGLEIPSHFAWLPDSHGVSFVYNNSLYVMPDNKED